MEKLIAALNEAGVAVTADMGSDAIQKVAKAVGIEPLDFMEREVKVVPYTNKRNQTNQFIETPSFVVGKDPTSGKTRTVRGLFLRAEALEQAITDLTAARELLKK